MEQSNGKISNSYA